ncbi:MAG: carboxypeptidase regulatory-like domain-containing protein, partial [Bryobacteraceae bacterium]
MVQLGGRVTDPSGGVIPAASVTVTNSGTGVKWEATTTEEGYYVIPLLPPGSYSVTVRKEGFRAVTRSGLILDTGFKRTADIELQVGSVTESVSVTSQTPLIETSDSSVGQLIERASILNMPLSDQRAAQLVRLTGAVVGSGTTFSIAGGRGQNQNWLLDGTTVQGSTIDNPLIIFNPPAESLQEFKVEMSNYSSEYGRAAGGEIVMTTRSGTNEFHGAAYEFLRNEKLDTRTFFARVKGPLRYNVFGASLGGPIVKNRTFFFFNYQGSRQRSIATNSAVVPHPQEVTGDFSNRTDLRLIDPSTGTQFPGNIIPASRIDPIGLQVAKIFPAPNFGNLDIRRIESTNYFVTQSTPASTDIFTAKVDHNFSSKDRVFVRVFEGPGSSVIPPLFPLDFERKTATLSHNITGGWIHQFAPTVLNEFRYNFGSFKSDGLQGVDSGRDNQFGFKGTTPNFYSTFSAAGFAGVGGSVSTHVPDRTHDVVNNLSWIRGRHQFKTGFEYRYGAGPDNTQIKGTTFSFSDRVTGSGLAELLLGRAASAANSGTWKLFGRMDNYSGYFQDEWKVSNRLTLNLGLRWEVETPRFDARNALSGLDLKAINPVCNCPGVVTFAGVNGSSKYASDFDWNNFGPRFGFA